MTLSFSWFHLFMYEFRTTNIKKSSVIKNDINPNVANKIAIFAPPFYKKDKNIISDKKWKVNNNRSTKSDFGSGITEI